MATEEQVQKARSEYVDAQLAVEDLERECRQRVRVARRKAAAKLRHYENLVRELETGHD